MEHFKNLFLSLPGFRSRKPRKMLLASLIYLVLLITIIQGVPGETGSENSDSSPSSTPSAQTSNIKQKTSTPNNSNQDTKSTPIASEQQSLDNPPQTQEQVKEQTQQGSGTGQTVQAIPAKAASPAVEKKESVVYITKTGEKYHLSGCRYLAKSKIEISLADAQAQGYDPCSVCNPPGKKQENQRNDSYSNVPATSPPAYQNPPAQRETKESLVYITKTGSKYHRDGCRYLSKSRIPINLSDAKAQGYDACSVCDPPE